MTHVRQLRQIRTTIFDEAGPQVTDEGQPLVDTGLIYFLANASTGKHSDVFIDNLSPEGDGLLEIAGFDEKVATVGDIINNWIMWIFTAQFVDEMIRRGWVPWFWMGGFRTGSGAYNTAHLPFFLEQGF